MLPPITNKRKRVELKRLFTIPVNTNLGFVMLVTADQCGNERNIYFGKTPKNISGYAVHKNTFTIIGKATSWCGDGCYSGIPHINNSCRFR